MQEFDQQKIDEPVSPPPIRPRRLRSIVAVVSSCVLFTIAGSCFLLTMLVRPHFVEGPQGADDVAAQITNWKRPADFTGKSGATIDNALLRFDIAKFAQREGRGFLLIAQLQSKSFQFPDQRTQTQELIERLAPELKKISIDQPEKRILTIRGLPAEFELGKGEDRASTTRYRQVIGYFRGRNDDAVLILQCEDDVLSEAEIDEFLKSID